jgi:hypothetical protein
MSPSTPKSASISNSSEKNLVPENDAVVTMETIDPATITEMDLDKLLEEESSIPAVASAPQSAPLGIADSKHAPQPSLQDLLDLLIAESKTKTTKYVLLSAKNVDDPSVLKIKKELDALDDKIKLIQRTMDQQKVAEAPINNNQHILGQIPVFQIQGLTQINNTHVIFDSVDAFIRAFEKVTNIGDIDLEKQWSKYLDYSMRGKDVDVWFSANMKNSGMNWTQAKKKLSEKFAFKDDPSAAILALASIKMKKNESIPKFGLRVQALSQQANWTDGPQLAVFCFRALPEKMRSDVITSFNKNNTDHSLPQTADEVLRIASKITIQKRSLEESDTEDEENHRPARRQRRQKDKNASTGLTCSLHGNNASHDTKDCKRLKTLGQQHNEKPFVPSSSSSKLCKFCHKAPYGNGHRCKEGSIYFEKMKKKPQVNAVLHRHPADMDIDDFGLHELNIQAQEDNEGNLQIKNKNIKKHYCHNMTSNTPLKKKYVFPLLLQNKQAFALCDSGANISVIDRSFINNNKIKINPNYSTTIYLPGNKTTKSYGKTNPILITFNDVTISHAFQVTDLSNDIDCLIADDLMETFNIEVTNLPISWPNSHLKSPPENHNIDNPPVPNESPAGTPKEREDFLNVILPLAAKNEKIPLTSFCTLPISQVRLETPNMPTDRTNHRQYPIAVKLQPIVDKAIDKWLAEGTIAPAPNNNTWNSPITLAPKKDEKGFVTGHRPCLDPRHINKYLKDETYPLPLIQDIFESMHGAAIFTTLDLTNAFHRFQIHPDDQHKTAFTIKGRSYVFLGAPFGLKHLSQIFQKTINEVFKGMPFIQTFIDDIVVFSPDMESHTKHVAEAITKLTEVNLILNPKKCHWAQRVVYLLGFCVSKDGHDLDPRKVCNVLEWDRPTSGKSMMQFLGIVNYFRNHLASVSTLTKPLDALRNHNKITDKDWTSVHQQHFDLIKEQLQRDTLLRFPDLSLPFHVATDASNYGLGAALYQIVNGEERFVGYMARSLSKSERNYSTNKRELLAIIFALKKFRKYLWGNPFTLYTDHRALTYIHTQKIASPMMINWLDTILDYSFKVIHKPGALNVFPDFLSRLATPHKEIPGGHHTSYTKANKEVQLDQSNKEEKKHIQAIQSMDMNYITPPAKEHRSILQRLHELGHFGAEAIVKAAHNEGIHWTNILKEALEIVQQCNACQMFNIGKRGYNPLRPVYAYLPTDHWAIDLAGPYKISTQGNTYLLVMVDVCTRFTILRALPDKKADTIIHKLIQVFGDFGYPRIIQSDNGTEFKNILDKALTKAMGIDRRYSTPYHPRGNGLAERYVQVAKLILNKEIKGTKQDWDWFVPNTQLAMNNKVSKRLQTPPFSLMFARHMNKPALTGNPQTNINTLKPMSYEDLIKRIEYMNDVVFPAIKERTQTVVNSQKEAFDKTHRIVDFPIGSYVVAKIPTRKNKSAPAYEGPFEVMQKTTNGTYVLKDTTGALASRNYVPSELKSVSHDDNDNIFEIEAVLDHKGTPGRRQYKVRWKGYSSAHDQWIDAKDMNAQDELDIYWKKREEIKNKKKSEINKSAPAEKRKRADIEKRSKRQQGKNKKNKKSC